MGFKRKKRKAFKKISPMVMRFKRKITLQRKKTLQRKMK
jgi:hypothetical protein